MINSKTHPVYNLLRDFYINIVPVFLIPRRTKRYHYCFLGHPRDYNEIYRKFPFLKRLPKFFLRSLTKYFFWPTTISDITGLKDLKSGDVLKGCVISVPMTSIDLLKDKKLALKKIRRAISHAKKQGVKIVGLAGYISSLSKGGLDVLDMNVGVTTGHAYTTLNVANNYAKFLKEIGLEDKYKDITIAIVGAAGSVGSSVAKYLAHREVKKIILIDLERKINSVNDLKDNLMALNPDGDYIVTTDITKLKEAPVVFTTTNASEALITDELCVPGTVFIDDTQPTDISKEAHYRDDVLVLEAGAVNTPNIVTHFNFGLKNKTDNFCCMAELLILSATRHEGNYVINRTTLDQVFEMEEAGKKLGFTVGEFQNLYNTIDDEKIKRVGNILRERLK